MSAERIFRWEAAIAVTLGFSVLGLLTGNAVVLLAGIVPLGFIVSAAVSNSPPPTGALTIRRDVSPSTVYPGDEATVEVTLENTGDAPFPSVHVEAAVPDDVTVVDGHPKTGTALEAGGTETFEYTVVASRGTHEFPAPTVRLRSLTGAVQVTEAIPAEGTSELRVTVSMDEMLLPEHLTNYAGLQETTGSGPGIEFHSTREYRRGDPVERIDWRRFAKTDELSTINFREPRTRRVAIVVDGRDVARRARATGRPDGATLAAYAGMLAANTLRSNGHDVAFAGLGIEGIGPSARPPAWIPADASNLDARIERVCEAIADHASSVGSSATPAIDGHARWIESQETAMRERVLARLPNDAQVLSITPLVDDAPVRLAKECKTYGHQVTTIAPDVVSPTATPATTPAGLTGVLREVQRGDADRDAESQQAFAQELVAIDRDQRIADLREHGVRVVDWPQSRPLPLAMIAALRPVIGNG